MKTLKDLKNLKMMVLVEENVPVNIYKELCKYDIPTTLCNPLINGGNNGIIDGNVNSPINNFYERMEIITNDSFYFINPNQVLNKNQVKQLYFDGMKKFIEKDGNIRNLKKGYGLTFHIIGVNGDYTNDELLDKIKVQGLDNLEYLKELFIIEPFYQNFDTDDDDQNLNTFFFLTNYLSKNEKI